MENDGITLYEIAKQMVANETPLDPILFNKEIHKIAVKIYEDCFGNSRYFFLICPDNRQYVMFHINPITSVENIEKELKEVLTARGTMLLIDDDSNEAHIWEFWLKDAYSENIYMYQLTPYEVIEV